MIGILLAGAAGTFALAFGLGGRDVARALSAGRYLRHDYSASRRSRAPAPSWTPAADNPCGCQTIY